ncbi:hypothetical protein DSM104329_00867 [Capillimicrobium parvum]|uniref:Uncharacterized protein n=1 Tax=Capillimicrobium parvum TaxID=2884022 RepID=A0A9E6XU90_9ACTN|nr:hypothetical protein DSM104329_00867 [Capillimicrobium parvum]
MLRGPARCGRSHKGWGLPPTSWRRIVVALPTIHAELGTSIAVDGARRPHLVRLPFTPLGYLC